VKRKKERSVRRIRTDAKTAGKGTDGSGREKEKRKQKGKKT